MGGQLIGRDCSRLCLDLRTQAQRVECRFTIVVSWAHNENWITAVVDVSNRYSTVWGGVHLRNT
uniref:hypothetical protein n=1 Tax=Escherichia coli TaxID=562 RepID=UPI001BDB730A